MTRSRRGANAVIFENASTPRWVRARRNAFRTGSPPNHRPICSLPRARRCRFFAFLFDIPSSYGLDNTERAPRAAFPVAILLIAIGVLSEGGVAAVVAGSGVFVSSTYRRERILMGAESAIRARFVRPWFVIGCGRSRSLVRLPEPAWRRASAWAGSITKPLWLPRRCVTRFHAPAGPCAGGGCDAHLV